MLRAFSRHPNWRRLDYSRRRFLCATLAVFLYSLLSWPVSAQSAPRAAPILLELFTSQVCSSCPPADKDLGRLARERVDVIALAYHVDYWDYLGWKDPYSKPIFSQRQRQYARRALTNRVYTPQLIAQGRYQTVGGNRKKTARILKKAAKLRPGGKLAAQKEGDFIVFEGNGIPSVGTADIFIAYYLDEIETPVKRGENAGQTLREYRVVIDFKRLKEYESFLNGGRVSGRARISETAAKADGVVIFVQRDGFSRILTAFDLRLRPY